MQTHRVAELSAVIAAAFVSDSNAVPTLTLRGGNALDDRTDPFPFDEVIDRLTDEYVEQFHWGIPQLDAASWRHVLPFLLAYALRKLEHASIVVDALLNSLRPPDRQPPRLASLSLEQEKIIGQVLDVLCFSPESAHCDLACQTTEEWWEPNAMYKPRPHDPY